MITERYYSDFTKQHYSSYDEAYSAEVDKSVEILHNSNSYIGKDYKMDNVLATENRRLNTDLKTFVPLTDEAVKAFLVLADYTCDLLDFDPSELKVRTPIQWDDKWKLLPDLVKHAHLIYTRLTDELAEIENALNTLKDEN